MSRLLDNGLAKIMAMIGYDSASESQPLPNCAVSARPRGAPPKLQSPFSSSRLTSDKTSALNDASQTLEQQRSIRMPLVKRQSTTQITQITEISTVTTSTPVVHSTTTTPVSTTTPISTQTTAISDSTSVTSIAPVASSPPSASASASSGAGGTDTLSTATSTATGGGSTSGAGSTPSGSTGSSSSGAGATGTITSTLTTTKPTSVPVSTSVADSSIVGPIGPAVVTGSTSNPVVDFPTTSYTGQAVLTSTCAQPLYTAFQDPDGSFIAAPIIGCDNQNPQCCPSLTQGPSLPSSVIPLNQLNSAVMDALNSAPITLCPGDYTSTAGVCCPVGFNLYQTQFFSLYPCVSTLATPYSVPGAVTQQLLSLSAAIASTATDANPTVSVHIVTDEVFALSLPLKGGVEHITHASTGLPLAAKIGIGVGAVLLLVALGFLAILCVSRNRRRGGRAAAAQQGIAPGSQTPAWLDAQRKSLASTTTAGGGAPTGQSSWDPRQGHFSYDSAASAGDAAGAGGYYKPAGDANPYVRTPPQRTSLQPMPMAQISTYGHAGGVQPAYSELPANSHEVYEADATQPYVGQGYSVNTAYHGPAHGQEAYEMDGLPQQQPQQQQYQPYQQHQQHPQQRNDEWI